MRMFKISCYGDGSYFSAYLQHVVVVADDQDKAIEVVKQWLKDNDESFVRGEKHWNIEDLGHITNNCVIDHYIASDY